MLLISFELLSNTFSQNSDKDLKDHQNFCRNLLKEFNRYENCPPKNKTKEYFQILQAEKNKKGDIIQEKLLNWFSKLSIDERKSICTMKSKLLAEIFLQLYLLYKDNNSIGFKPTEEISMLFQNYEEQKDFNRENIELSLNNNIINQNGNKEGNLNEYIKDPNDFYYYKKYFTYYNRKESKEDYKKTSIENELLKNLKIISSDKGIITLTEELLSDFEKFKKIFKYITNDNCFKDWLLPIKNYTNYYFKLPFWISKIKSPLTLFQIIISFFEQQILVYYEYFFYTNRIYQSSNQNNIIELYKEINNIVSQLNNESSYLNNIFSENIIKEIINKLSSYNIRFDIVYNDLNKYLMDFNNEKQKLKKLLDKLTFLDFNDVINGKIIIYNSYKKYILDYFRDKFTEELIREDKTKKKAKKHKKNKNKNNNNNKIEIKENENIQKEENRKEEKTKDNEGEKEKEKENKINDNIKEENKNQEAKKNKKYKECFLFTNNSKKDKKDKKDKKNKKNKMNKLNETNLNRFSQNKENKNESNKKLIRIISKTSISTFKSSNYQDDVISNTEEDLISMSSDINENSLNIIEQNISNNNKNDKNDIDKNIDCKINNNQTNVKSDNNYNNINESYHINNNNKINNFSNNKKINTINYTNPDNYINKIHHKINHNNNYNNQNNSQNNNFLSKPYSHNFNYNNNNFTYNNMSYSFFNYNYYNQEIYNYCLITDKNMEILNNIKISFLNILENKIKNHFKNKYNLTFGHYGSHYTGLSVEGSDIDICIIFKKLNNDNIIFYQELFDFLEERKTNLIKFTYETKSFFNASIPRITLTIDVSEEIKKTPLTNLGYLSYDDMNKVKIDFTFNENEQYLIKNIKNVEYVKSQIKIYPQIRPVILVLKRYLKNMKMNEVHFGGISSYSLFLIVLNSLKSYQEEMPYMKITYSHLLIKTFQKFSVFNFVEYGIGKDNSDYLLGINNSRDIPYIIDPLTGYNVPKGICKGINIRESFSKGYNLLLYLK